MPKPRETAPPGTKRCGAADHIGPRVLPDGEFTPTAKNGGYCHACMREWRMLRAARRRGEVAADVGPDYLARAEARLYPGRAYASLGAAERAAAVELARSLALAAGAMPAGAAA